MKEIDLQSFALIKARLSNLI